MASRTSCTFGCKSVLSTRGQAPRSVLTDRGLATPACSVPTLRIACDILSLIVGVIRLRRGSLPFAATAAGTIRLAIEDVETLYLP